MKNDNLRSRTIGGMIWKLAEKIGTQGVQFIIQIILARLLLPEDYGIVGLITIFISICDVFVLQGFTTALIQKKDADNIDFSSVFWANFCLSSLLYLIMFFSAPFIAKFYKEPQLVLITRVLSLNVIIGALGSVHNAIMAKSLEFKKSFIRGLSNILTYGIVGIIFAYWGLGVWALVYSKLAGQLIGSIVLWLTVKWTPNFCFSSERVKSLFYYSSKILGTNLLNTVFNNIHSLIIGRFFNKTDLGYYQRGQQIPQVAMTAIDGSINEVMYPTFSLLQNDLFALKSALRRSVKTSTYIIFPILLGLWTIAEPLTLVLLTEKWLPSVPYMQLTCIICMFWPLSACTHALNAIGKSGLTFKMSLISKSLTLICISICLKFGIYAIMLGTIIASFFSVFITQYYANKYIAYSYKELFFDMIPAFIGSIIMAGIVKLVSLLNFNAFVEVCVQVLVGIFVYVLYSWIFKIDSFKYLLSLVWKMKRHRNKSVKI